MWWPPSPKVKEPVHAKEPQMGEACIVMMRQIVQSSCALAMWHDALVWNGDEWCLFNPSYPYGKLFGQISPSSFSHTSSWTCDHWDWVPPQDFLTTKWQQVMPVNSSENLSSMFRSSERNLYECHASSPQCSTKRCLGKRFRCWRLLTTVPCWGAISYYCSCKCRHNLQKCVECRSHHAVVHHHQMKYVAERNRISYFLLRPAHHLFIWHLTWYRRRLSDGLSSLFFKHLSLSNTLDHPTPRYS